MEESKIYIIYLMLLCKSTSSIELANNLAEKNKYVYVLKRLSATMQAVVFLSVFISCRGPWNLINSKI